jgi:hypothetical protein
MAIKRVIAYCMHETERVEAEHALANTQVTDSFVVGDLDESQIAALEGKGLIVAEATPTAREPLVSRPKRQAKPRAVVAGVAEVAEVAEVEPPAPALVAFYVLRLRGPLVEAWRQQLEQMDVKLIESVDGIGFKTRLRIEQVAAVSALDFVESVTWITPEGSVPSITTHATPAEAGVTRTLTFDVRVHLPEDRAKIEQWLRDRSVRIVGTGSRKIRIEAAEDAPLLDDVGRLPEVDTVAEHVPPTFFNDVARQLLGIDATPPANPPTFIAQDGSGQIVAVADTGIDQTHPDFQGRIAQVIARGRPGNATDPEGHGTHVAGSILGDGSASGGTIKGTAPKAKLVFQSLLDTNGHLGGLPVDLNDLFDEAYQAGARIHNNSWGAETPSLYTIDSEEVDEFVRKHPDMLVLIAAGNAGTAANPVRSATGFVDWLSIGSPASCKNALTVGASRSSRTTGPMGNRTYGSGWPTKYPAAPIANEKVSGDPKSLAAFSARGPCDDRRIKPDVVAPGTDILSTWPSTGQGEKWGPYASNPKYAYNGGTSMATPLVAGCAALIRQYYVEQRQHQPSAALLKATLVNSTNWLTGADAVAPTLGTPNYHQGYGMVDMRNAIPNAANPNLQLQFIDNWQNPATQFSHTGDRRRYQFNLPAGVKELRICLAYTDKAARALQNNLNLILQNLTTQKKWMGNADLPDRLTLPDPDNNVETIRIANPPAGPYMIQVFVSNLLQAPQDFALVVTGEGVPALVSI